jgi:hypothetical protein
MERMREIVEVRRICSGEFTTGLVNSPELMSNASPQPGLFTKGT